MDLYLDHFYSSIPKDQIDNLLPLADLISGASYNKIKLENISYEGIYIHTQTGPYIEFVLEHNIKYISIAVHTPDSPLDFSDLPKLPADNFQWDKGETRMRPNDDDKPDEIPEPWLRDIGITQTDVYTGDNIEIFKQVGWAAPWIVDYQNQKYNRSLQILRNALEDDISKYDIVAIISFSFRIPDKYKEYDSFWFSWIGELVNRDDEKIELVLDQTNGDKIPVIYYWGGESIGFRSISFKVADIAKFQEIETIGTTRLEVDVESAVVTIWFEEY